MLSYRTPDEISAWAAAGRPELAQGEWKRALDAASVFVVPDDTGALIGPDGNPGKTMSVR